MRNIHAEDHQVYIQLQQIKEIFNQLSLNSIESHVPTFHWVLKVAVSTLILLIKAYLHDLNLDLTFSCLVISIK